MNISKVIVIVINELLPISDISAILFIKINGPPIAKFNSEKYVKNWLREHNHAESSHNTGREESKETIIKKMLGIFVILCK